MLKKAPQTWLCHKNKVLILHIKGFLKIFDNANIQEIINDGWESTSKIVHTHLKYAKT